jgi:hypothetical protein
MLNVGHHSFAAKDLVMTNMSQLPFSEHARQLQALLAQAVLDADAGHPFDIVALQEGIGALCERAATVAPEEREAARHATEVVLEHLDILTALLVSQRDALQYDLGNVTTSKAAAKAYLKAKKE